MQPIPLSYEQAVSQSSVTDAQGRANCFGRGVPKRGFVDHPDSTHYYNNFYYDPAGNRTRLEYNDGGGTTTTTYLYNPADQLTRETVGGTNTDYLYDANGSLTKKDDGTNVHSYTYDFRNRSERSARKGGRRDCYAFGLAADHARAENSIISQVFPRPPDLP